MQFYTLSDCYDLARNGNTVVMAIKDRTCLDKLFFINGLQGDQIMFKVEKTVESKYYASYTMFFRKEGGNAFSIDFGCCSETCISEGLRRKRDMIMKHIRKTYPDF